MYSHDWNSIYEEGGEGSLDEVLILEVDLVLKELS
jgi:hypothetical protein